MKSILVIGASARAAAASAHRAGWHVYSLDLFADHDLRQFAKSTRIDGDFPQRAAELAFDIPPMPWMFTGGIENHPLLIEQISQSRPLLGTGPDSILRIRNLKELAQSVQKTSFQFPRTQTTPPASNQREQWLVKPTRSCGGTNVRFHERNSPVDEGVVWQQYINGISYSAAFVADGNRCELLGVTRQWVAKDARALTTKSMRSPFAYVGSVGPLPSITAACDWLQLGRQLVADFELFGVFGVDAVMTKSGQPYVMEVNPRYTASMELMEDSLNRSIVQTHIDACQGKLPNISSSQAGDSAGESGKWYDHRVNLVNERPQVERPKIYAKAYYFAQNSFRVSRKFVETVNHWPTINDRLPRTADIPNIGCSIKINQPVLTVFEVASSEATIERAMGWRSDGGWLRRIKDIAEDTCRSRLPLT